MLLMIDNYDSFTYNLVQYLRELGEEVVVYRNDKITLAEIAEMQPERLVISPGPCTPNEAGISVSAIKHFAGQLPILGVCLGHQAIGYVFGGNIINAPEIIHGKLSEIFHDGKTLFEGLKNPFHATRYHSLVVDTEGLPEELEVSAKTSDGIIMGLRHKKYRIEGVQFHPESFLTDGGKKLLKNFIKE